MSKSTNTVVYFDWKTVIYSYVCGKCRTQFILPMEKSVTFTGTCANEIIPSVNRSMQSFPSTISDGEFDYSRGALYLIWIDVITYFDFISNAYNF